MNIKVGNIKIISTVFFVGVLHFLIAVLPVDAVALIGRGEFSVVEILSAVFYFLSFLIMLWCLRMPSLPVLTRINVILWMLFVFIFFGEETSWLQHYVGYATPEYFVEHNSQREFNFHNLSFLQGGSIFEFLSGEQGWSFLLKSQNLFQIGFCFYFIVLPLVSRRFVLLGDFCKKIQAPIVDNKFILSLSICLFISLLFTLIYREFDFYKKSIAETREMVYALFIFIFILEYRSKILFGSRS